MTENTEPDDAADVPTADARTDDSRVNADTELSSDVLADPASLADREDIDVREKRRDVDEETFELFADHEGVAAVGITRADGALLLWEGPHGWTLPFTFVEPDDDWIAAARTVIAELTGVSVEIADVESLRCVENALVDGDAQVTTYELVYRARTVTDETVVRELSAFEADEEHPDVGWFDDVPAIADNEDDIRSFLE